jgi:poly(3-hydroxyoctanoate) depolymerase
MIGDHLLADADVGVVDVGGHRLRVRVQGPARGIPLLLINGLGGNLETWNPVIDALPGTPTIAFDAPGAGGSPLPPKPLMLCELARIVIALLDTLGVGQVDVLGFSLGGAIAQEVAHRAPKRVRRLVLAATSCGIGSLPGNPIAMSHLGNPYRYYSPRYFSWVAPHMMGGRLRHDPKLVRHYVKSRILKPPSPHGFLWQILAAAGWSSLPWLHRLPQPTLILTGDDDPLVPVVNARILAACIPNSRLKVVQPGGHLFLLDGTADVLGLVTNFLDSAAA